MTSFADVIARATPSRTTVEICIDGSAHADLEAARARASSASSGMSQPAEVRAALAAAQARVDAGTVTFEVHAVGSYAWTDLLVAHQVDPSNKTDVVDFGVMTGTFRPGVLVARHSYTPAIISASVTEPKMTIDEADQLLRALNHGQTKRLIDAVFSVNSDDGDVPKSARLSDGTSNSDAKPISAANAASPEASSTDE